MLALAGITLFANDRPPRECQRIVQLPPARHPEDSAVVTSTRTG
jgi:hypothetical protein